MTANRVSPYLLALSCAAIVATLAVTTEGWARYKRIPVQARSDVAEDASFRQFRASLRQVAQKQDLKLVEPLVGPMFVWEGDFGGGYDKNASPFQNLVTALQLDNSKLIRAARGKGWRKLDSIAGGEHFTRRKIGTAEAVCGPVPATFRAGAIKSDDLAFWGYVLGREAVRADKSAASSIIAHVQDEAIQVETWAPEVPGRPQVATVMLPDGRKGYIAGAKIQSFLGEQLCFRKIDGQWRIVGYIGGGD